MRSVASLRASFVACFTIAGLLALIAVYSIPLNSPPIRSDGVGYYLYLPGILIHQDPGLTSVARHSFEGEIPRSTGARIWPGTERYLIKYPGGEALLLLPFFLLGGLVAKIAGAAMDGFSWPFQLFAALAGLTYGSWGIALLWRTMERWFEQRTILLTMVGVAFGTNLLHYATYDNIFSHIYSFFLFAAFLRCTQAVFDEGRARLLVVMGALGGLILITRPTNGLWLIVGVLYGLRSARDVEERVRFLCRHYSWLLGGFAAFAAFVGLQLLYWKTITGHWVVYSYQRERPFDFVSPHVQQVLFSVRKGLCFWSPLWLAALPGLFFLARRVPAMAISAIVYLPLHVYVVSIWRHWSYGGSFGQRPFVESIPLLALCLAAWYEGLSRPAQRRGLLVYGGLCVALSLWLMLKYWTGVIPFDGTTWDHFTRTFFQLKR